jgi:hypothetical protein
MARPVYSTRFIQQHGLSGSASFAVPSGYVAVVRDVDTFIGTPVGANTLYFHGALGQAIWFTEGTIGQSQYASWRGRQVFEPGETFDVQADVGVLDAYDVTVSGYLLALP